MIEPLDNRSAAIAAQIHGVFQRSYRREADLIGVDDFPPLRRTVRQIQSSDSRFLGLRDDTELAAVVEYSIDGTHLSIDNLAVDPRYFRRGFGTRILRALFDRTDFRTAGVETAAENAPAIGLYEKIGCRITRRWQTAEGIEKVELSCPKEA